MSRPATDRLKCNPPLGRMPVLQHLRPSELLIDEAYQRSLDAGPSQTLIRKIAQHWNWDLFQSLVVARRDNGDLYVIDGQHRLAAARLRGDIAQLPAVVVQYANREDEAASFVHLNQQRRPLSKLDIFKAAVASGDSEATAIVNALSSAGLSIAPHSNFTAWKPGMVSNVGGIEAAWRQHGLELTTRALKILANAFSGQRLQFAGTVFPGIVAVCAHSSHADPRHIEVLVKSKTQTEWRAAVMQARANDPNLRYNNAVAKVFLDAWKARFSVRGNQVPAPPPPTRPIAQIRLPEIPSPPDNKRWCDQCDRRVALTSAALCKDRHCKLRPRLTR